MILMRKFYNMALHAWGRVFTIAAKRICSPAAFTESSVSSLRTASFTCYQPIILRKYSDTAEETETSQKAEEATEPALPYTRSNKRRIRRLSRFVADDVEKILKEMEQNQSLESDQPVKMDFDPYKPDVQRCMLCQTALKIDYKNVRLLSQFVSPYTGLIYGRNKTGLCLYMQKKISQAIMKSRMAGFMPAMYTDRAYSHDPKLFDIFAQDRHKKKLV